uniref:DUF2170 family protein n=1 Tax=Halomonas sp. TaxID=1486246 RepID=UPI00260526A4|nr:DUF2170 family protein [Halomonas sp.]
MSWNLDSLKDCLRRDEWEIAEEGDCLRITNEDGLDAYLAVSGEQIVVESVLFSREDVKDEAGLNEKILRTHQIFPLTTIAISTINGEDYYIAFGALFSESKPESIVTEVESLFGNIPAFLEAYEEHLI